MAGTLKKKEVYGLVVIKSWLLLPWRKCTRSYPSLVNQILVIRTCFWAGNAFAPKLLIKNKKGENIPVQQFLQDAYLDMTEMLVKAVGDLEGVIGFEVSFILSLEASRS